MNDNINILYVSILGMGEPLGKSQVLEYLKELSGSFNISLHSFEKDVSSSNISLLQDIMDENKISWTYQEYSNRFGIISTIFQIISGFSTLLYLIISKKIKIIHARSLIPVIISLPFRYLTGAKVIFDIRGFQTDEKAEVGRITYGGILYKFLRFLEEFSYRQADVIVSLIHCAKSIIGTVTTEDKIIVIPTCANSNVFRVCNTDGLKEQYGYANTDRIFVHVGAVGSWYDFDAELKLMKSLMTLDPDIMLLVLNKGEHGLINKKFIEYMIPKEKVRVIEADFYEVYKYLNIAEASLFIIKPSYSKKASMPTKFAENLCCELFSITNGGIGDMDYFINKFPEVGFSFPKSSIDTDLPQLSKNILEKLRNREKKSGQYKKLYEELMSNSIAVKRYTDIYKTLSAGF